MRGAEEAEARTDEVFEKSVDVVVLGAGASGMTAAFVCARLGLDVLVLEKSDKVGGTMAYSAGVCWVPDNDHQRANGYRDNLDLAHTYLRGVIGDATDSPQIAAYLHTAPAAFRFLEENSSVKFAARAYTPDYWSDLPGSVSAGRALAPVEFDGRLLGNNFDAVLSPPEEFLALGGMMMSIGDIGHIIGRFKTLNSLRHTIRLVLRYLKDRIRQKRGTRLVMGNALAGMLFKSLLDSGVPVWREAVVDRLLVDDDGRISGVWVRHGGKEMGIRARGGVVIATGGFANNAAMRADLAIELVEGRPSGSPANTGDGIRLATAVGAAMGKKPATGLWWTPVSRRKRKDGTVYNFPHLVLDRSKPGLIAVNFAGKRFINEATNYHDFTRVMLRQPAREDGAQACLVCDSNFMDRYTLGLAYPGRKARARLVREGYLFRGDTPHELAEQLGIDPTGLARTLDDYNLPAMSGHDPEFGKGSSDYNRYLGDPLRKPSPCVAPIEAPPYYGIPIYAGDFGTCHGLAVDSCGRVLDQKDQPIDGLFACGNDMNTIMDGFYPGAGITLGPALTFGYIVGKTLGNHQKYQD